MAVFNNYKVKMSIKVTDVSEMQDDFFSIIDEFKSEVAGKTLSAPKINKEPGIIASGEILSGVMQKDVGKRKVTMWRYRVAITGLFKQDDVMPNVGVWESPTLIEAYRFGAHPMNAEEKKKFTEGGKQLGQRLYTVAAPLLDEDGTPRMVQFAVPQFLEISSFEEWSIHGRKARAGDKVTMGNLRFEEKVTPEKVNIGFKCENVAAAQNLGEFETIQGLSRIAPCVNVIECLWHTEETANMPKPKRIDDAMKTIAADDTMGMNKLELEKRIYQSTPQQRVLFATSLCIPTQESSAQSLLTRQFLKFYTRPVYKAEEGASQREIGGKYIRVEASLFMMQMNAGKREKVALHIAFDRDAMNEIGVHNNYVKKALVPMMLRAMRDGKMWCNVDVVGSTKHQEVPRDESGVALADYSLFLKCMHVSFDRAAMVRAISLPITDALAQHLYSTGGQSNIRDSLGPVQSLRLGDPVYNASECQGQLDPTYDYYLMCPQLSELNIRQFFKLSEEKKWSPEKAREEVSKYLLGKGGSDGETTFGTLFVPPQFTATEPAVLWGIKKDYKEPPAEDEAALLQRYISWKTAAISPDPATLIAIGRPRVEEVESDEHKRKADEDTANAAKRIKQEEKKTLKD